MGSSLLLLALAGLAAAFPADDPLDGGKHWVVIVAGSNGWYNYRHQVRDAGSTAPPNRARVLTCPLHRPTPAMPTRSCTGTGSRTSRSW